MNKVPFFALLFIIVSGCIFDSQNHALDTKETSSSAKQSSSSAKQSSSSKDICDDPQSMWDYRECGLDEGHIERSSEEIITQSSDNFSSSEDICDSFHDEIERMICNGWEGDNDEVE
ncbi:MAG: hypothetical protein OCD01_19465 [Fibrobacterales bacterium]